MGSKFFLHFKRIIFIAGCLYTLVYTIASLTPYFSSADCFLFTFFGLLYPMFLAAMLVWMFIVLFFYRKYFWFFFLLVFIGSKNIFSVFGLNIPQKFQQQKQENSIRILSWNVADFIDSQIATDTVGNVRRDIFSFVEQTNPDIVCIQDFSEKDSTGYKSNIDDMLKAGGFKYYNFTIDFVSKKYPYPKYGTAIFSKFPIVDTGRVLYPTNKFSESIAYASIKINSDTVIVYNTHLQSMYLKLQLTNEALEDEFIKPEISFLETNTRYRERLVHFDKNHVQQALQIKQVLQNCKQPFIFCADLNSVPSSFTYHTIKSNYKDVFLEKGFGFGGTYDGFSPTIRIDVMLTSNNIKTMQYYSPRLKISDHFPVLADVQLK